LITITDGQTDTILDDIDYGDFWGDNHHKSLKDNIETFDFTTFADKSYSQYLSDKNRIVIPDEDGSFIEFEITNHRKYHGQEGKFIEVYTSASYLSLQKAKVIRPQKLQGATAKSAAQFAVEGTEFEVGEVHYAGIRTINIERHTNPYTLLKRIAREFNLELRFHIEKEGNKIVGRYVDLLERVGEWQGREVEFGKDLIDIERKEDTNNIVTALVGLGPEDENGNRIEVFVEDKEALQRWGRRNPKTGELMHIVETYEPQSEDTEMTESRLRELTKNELEKRVNALVEYVGYVSDLEKVPGLEHEEFRFGDTIKLKDTSFNPPLYLEARVHTQDRPLSDPSQKKVTLGDFIELGEEEVFEVWKALQQQINERLSKMVIVNIVANGGIAFKNGQGSTDLKAVTYLQGQEVDSSGLSYEYTWQVYDKNGNLIGTSGGKQFTVHAKDIDEKSTYIVKVSDGEKEMSSAVVTVTNVFDGEQGPPGPKGEKGDQGPQGPAGTSVTSITEYYLATNLSSGVTTETSGWTTTMQQMTPQKRYLWNYERINFSDGTYQNTNPVIIGVYGDEGEEGRSVVDITEYYLASSASSGVTRSTSGWTTTMQVTTPEKRYLWNYEKITWNKAPLETYTDPVIVGVHGEQGPKGEDGKTFYTWIKYADTPTSGMSDSPEGKEYIGIAYNKETPTPSTNYADYIWAKFKGEQGIPGPPGEDGQPTYTWVKYADDENGNGMSDSPDGKLYIGLAFNKTTPEESNNPADYTWSLMPQNIEIGGRNLIILTDALHGYPLADGTLHSTSAARTPKEYIKVKPGEQYVLSIPYSDLADNVVRLAQFDESKNFVRRPLYGGGETEGDVRVHYITIPDNVYYIWPGFAKDAKVKLEKGNKATDWTPAPEDVQAEIDEAKQDAQNAQQTADGKNTVFYQSTKPSLMGRKEGDLWFKSDEGYKPFRFNGSDFVEASFGHQAIATLDLGKATVGKLSGQFIETKTLEAGHIKSLNGLNIGNGQFVVDSNGNVSFKGKLDGADGAFNGVLTNKGTYGTVTIDDGVIELNDIDLGWAEIKSNGVRIYNTLTNRELRIGADYITSPDGDIMINSDIVTAFKETGYCGVGGYDFRGDGGIAGVGVNFRKRKTYVPSSVTLSPISQSPDYEVITYELSPDGFYMALQGKNHMQYRFWRGTYTA
jgi:phage minor structural protein